jgi:hypothetical protein
MKKILFSLILGTALVTTGCGVFHASAPVPGSVNQFDSDTYLSLVSAKAVIDQTKTDLANGAFPASITANVKKAVNDAVNAYNVADVAWQQYHTSATPAGQSVVTSAMGNLQTAVNSVTNAKAGK